MARIQEDISPAGANHSPGTQIYPLRVDGHVDLPYYMMEQAPHESLSTLQNGPFTLEKARAVGVRIFCTAVYCQDKHNGQNSYEHFEEILQFTLDRFDSVQFLSRESDFVSIQKSADSMGTVLLLENADCLAGHPERIERLKEKGFRMVGLTHAGTNRLGDGNGVPFPDGISSAGAEAIRSLQPHGFAIDTAHLHPSCFRQLLSLFEGTIVTTHTGVRNICDTPRNIDLEQARHIVERRGVIGVSLNPEMRSHNGIATVQDVFVHVDVLVQKFGPLCVGLGSDFCGFDTPARGLEHIGRINELKEVLLSYGYGDEGSEQVLGGSWMRLYQGMYKE